MAKIKFQQFPNIFRTIPENKFYLFLMIFLGALLLFFILILIVDVWGNYNNLVRIANKRANIESKINFWKSITDKYDGYKDAYFQIAILEYSLGNLNLSKLANNKALLLDPNFEDAKKLQEIISK